MGTVSSEDASSEKDKDREREVMAVEAELIDDEEAAEAEERGAGKDAGSPGKSDSMEEEAGKDEGPSVEELESQLAETKDRYIRLQAEWDNYRKRMTKEREQEKSRANERLVTSLLPILDDLERAIAAADGSHEDDPMLTGVKAVYTKFVEVLEKEGVEVVNPDKGDAFDANVHQAVAQAEDASLPNESIVTVYQKGYTLGGKNLRPAMVVVSTGGPKRQK